MFARFRVLKPPGGGSSDIFGAAPEETSPRRIKAHNQSQLGSALFGSDANGTDGASAVVSPRSNKPGNDSYKRLFGPPDAPPPTTPNARNHMRSNIPLSGGSAASLLSPGAMMSPAKSMSTSSSVISNSPPSVANGFAGNGLINDVTGKGPSRSGKKAGRSSSRSGQQHRASFLSFSPRGRFRIARLDSSEFNVRSKEN